ncbi:hypothetical protein BST81_21050 [Leptolyngbya sp. 'hensonii']|uniref:two-partner secretion domain-containing protein n=1 Tax=Leptolyngbya sp. 'hensonii' TaxID=1922337 RepID=UPI0009500464|nr:filamentous hemagglutinin N-terminal domain-containing protein [Leptolyngbya sp. 'hensonii']OLP16468.1 hypothetical protein BST81_21050 [Leptolyngbya sp. 'hensonii']
MKPRSTRLPENLFPSKSFLGFLLSLGMLTPGPGMAQPIVPATDGIGTTVTLNGNVINITGGQEAGTNLFQSFQQFGLDQGQVANFLANPGIQNILGRVTGGDPSIINGLIQVTGSNANLYLMNPAGIIFGPTATLNVPAAFTATTARGIGFGDQWFGLNTSLDALKTLTGSPNGFAFTTAQSGAIVNSGNLTGSPGSQITLVGGLVVNTGTIAAPGGTVTIAAVPGERLVRITQSGSLLSLELPIGTKTALDPASPLMPLALPQLLTGTGMAQATGLTVNPDGTVSLTSSGIGIPTTAGTTIVSGQISVALPDASGVQFSSGTIPEIVLLGDKVGLMSAQLDASGPSGGTILIGGDAKGQGTVSNASQTFVSQDSVITANALQTGNGGKVIVWADQGTQFYGTIAAKGGSQSGNGGFVEVSGKQSLVFKGKVDTTAANGITGTLLLDPANILIQDGNNDGNDSADAASTSFVGSPSGNLGQVLGADVDPTVIFESELEGLAGNTNVILEATNDITIADLADNNLDFNNGGGTITFKADSDGNGVGNFVMNGLNDTINVADRSLTISAVNITAGSFTANDGSLSLAAKNNISAQSIGSFVFTNFVNVSLSSTSGNISFNNITAAGSSTGSGGTVVVSAPQGTVQVGTATNQGFISAGQSNKVTDSTITITAGKFKAINPFNNPQDLNSNPAPVSLIAFPAGVVDTTPPTPPPPAKFQLSFAGDPQIIQVGTSGPVLISITLTQDKVFNVGTAFNPNDPAQSGLQGSIGFAAKSIPPNVLVLLQNNSFSSTFTPSSPSPLAVVDQAAVTAERSARQQGSTTDLAACRRSDADDGTLLQVSNGATATPPTASSQARGEEDAEKLACK